MKRFKRLVIGGIESKVLALVLISMLLVATVYSVSMLAQNDVLANLSSIWSQEPSCSSTRMAFRKQPTRPMSCLAQSA